MNELSSVLLKIVPVSEMTADLEIESFIYYTSLILNDQDN